MTIYQSLFVLELAILQNSSSSFFYITIKPHAMLPGMSVGTEALKLAGLRQKTPSSDTVDINCGTSIHDTQRILDAKPCGNPPDASPYISRSPSRPPAYERANAIPIIPSS